MGEGDTRRHPQKGVNTGTARGKVEVILQERWREVGGGRDLWSKAEEQSEDTRQETQETENAGIMIDLCLEPDEPDTVTAMETLKIWQR